MLSCLLYSCVYEPKDFYYLDVTDNPAPPEIQTINLNSYNDTIYIYFNKTTFTFQSSNQEVKAARFLINGEEYENVQAIENTFTLQYLYLDDGVYELTVELFTGSGTGSLADQLGYEGFLLSKSWKLIVSQDYYFKTSSIAENGLFKLIWPQYKPLDFKEYIIYKEFTYMERREIGRTTETSFFDNTYVGEGADYYVKVLTKSGEVYSWGGYEATREIPELFISVSDQNEYQLTWRKSKYYGAIDSVKVSMAIDYSSEFEQIYTTRNINDTVLLLGNVYFGDDIRFRLNVVPKPVNYDYTEDAYTRFYTEEMLRIGINFNYVSKTLNNFWQVSPTEFVFTSGCDSLIQFSTTSESISNKYGYTPVGCTSCNFSKLEYSPSGKYITNYEVCSNDVMLINGNNLSLSTKVNLEYLSGSLHFPPIPVSDNGLGIVNQYDGFYLYNFNSHQSVAFYPVGSTGDGLKISVTGKYLFLRDDSTRLVKYENNQFAKIWATNRSYYFEYFEFHPLQTDLLLMWDKTTFFIRQCEDFSVVTEFELTDEKILHIDFYNDEILTFNTGELLVRALSDGAIKYQVPINFSALYWYDNCILVNHTIICNRGILHYLN